MIDVLDSKDSAEKVVQRYRTYLKHADKLTTRCNLVLDGLHSMQMTGERLESEELVSLLFSHYNPLVQNTQAEREKK